jgi:hypothetical protein
MSTDQSTPTADQSTGPLVLVVQPDGTAATEHLPASGNIAQDHQQLAAINEAVGGHFTTIGDGHWLALVNEDGEAFGLPVNPQADYLARALGFKFRMGDRLLGPVVFTSRHGDELGDCPATVIELARQAGVIA